MQHHSVLLHVNLPLPSHFPLYPTNPLDQITGELQSATLHPRPHTSVSRVGEEGEVSMGTTHNDVRPVYTYALPYCCLPPCLFSP